MAIKKLARELGQAVKDSARKGHTGWWYTPHMAAATRAIAERIPLVDIVVEVRDARIPLSSEYDLLRDYPSSPRRIIVLNKMDLANRSQTKGWMRCLEQQNCVSLGINSHNKENINELLNFLSAQARELKRSDHISHTITVMLLGIPNVGKSALANSLHHIGRISAAEKGKLKHAIVSPEPGDTKDINSFKIASHPNIYVLDTPGILPPKVSDVEVCSKLALTGAIKDCLAEEEKIAQYFLAYLHCSEEYKKWENLQTISNGTSSEQPRAEYSCSSGMNLQRKRQYATDHTQDFVVNGVRRTLYQMMSCSAGNTVGEMDLKSLTEVQFKALQEAFHVPTNVGKNAKNIVAAKILNLFRTGRLGCYTLDPILENTLEPLS